MFCAAAPAVETGLSGPRGCWLLYILPFTLSHSPLKESTDKLQQRRPPSVLHGIPASLFGAVPPDNFTIKMLFFIGKRAESLLLETFKSALQELTMVNEDMR